jgi:NitT/TauT family transport system ATP-binding protein
MVLFIASQSIVRPAQMAAVALRAIRRTFGAVTALDGVDLTIEEGEFVAIVGPSGCGKSTLLRAVAGLDKVDSGEVEVDRSGIAYVFQDAHLLPWRTVASNVGLPLQLSARLRSRLNGDDAVRRALSEVELADSADRYPAELSGGMRMRASIARALVTEPRLLLMDEPFAALDEITRQRLDERLRALSQSRKLTVVFVTHSIFEATFLADRVVVMSKRPGRIVHDGPIDLPRERTSATRGDPAFARAAAEVLAALERGSE